MERELIDPPGPDLLANDSDRALVFLDWLGRFSESDSFDELSPAEQRIMWDLEASIEKTVTGTFRGDYKELVAAASARIVASFYESE